MLTIILFLVFVTAGLIAFSVVPTVYARVENYGEKKRQDYSDKMIDLVGKQKATKMGKLFVLAPVALGGVFFVLSPEPLRVFGVVLGVGLGFVFPGIYIKGVTSRRRDKFTDQLVDGLMIMSSSFRGGLSLVQAVEAVAEEMPDPISEEFSIVLGENKMGVSLEEALNHLYRRMPSVALQQMNTAILLARETGGNLPVIFNRIVTNIRETKKIRQNLSTLTLQGKIQGFVMSGLPLGFGFIVYNSNRRIFDQMINHPTGQKMLIYAVISWLMGVFMILKISSFKDF